MSLPIVTDAQLRSLTSVIDQLIGELVDARAPHLRRTGDVHVAISAKYYPWIKDVAVPTNTGITVWTTLHVLEAVSAAFRDRGVAYEVVFVERLPEERPEQVYISWAWQKVVPDGTPVHVAL